MKGYKVFNPDWTCRNFQYEVGKIFEEDVIPRTCYRGFHFCENAADCFSYYPFNSENKVAEIIALGDVDSDGIKSCTNKIQIVREIPWQELLTIVNTGKNCTGLRNTGNRNTGNRNTGNRNAGNRNAGNMNTGDENIGDGNTGDRNTGNRNTGDRNIGNRNTGNRNIGNKNTGNRNTGNWYISKYAGMQFYDNDCLIQQLMYISHTHPAYAEIINKTIYFLKFPLGKVAQLEAEFQLSSAIDNYTILDVADLGCVIFKDAISWNENGEEMQKLTMEYLKKQEEPDEEEE